MDFKNKGRKNKSDEGNEETRIFKKKRGESLEKRPVTG